MKTKNNKIVKGSNTNTLLRKTFERNKMISVKNTKMFLTFLNKLSWRVVILATMSSLKGARNRVKMIHNFGRYLVNCNRKHGPDWVIAYLKASQLALSKFIAREPLGSLMEVNPDYIFPRLAHGLPKIIGPRDRVSLRHNNRGVLILWMSIFGVFRILQGTYKLKLSTISNPFSGKPDFLAEKSVLMSDLTRNKLRALEDLKVLKKDGLATIKAEKMLLLSTSSPSSKVSWKGMLMDVIGLTDKGIYPHLCTWLQLTQSPLLKHLKNIHDIAIPQLKSWGPVPRKAKRCAYILDKNQARGPLNPFIAEWNPKDQPGPGFVVLWITTPSTPREIKDSQTILHLLGPLFYKSESAVGNVGQLQFVKEAAGKLRVFAMVDVWTQSIMQPVHKCLTNILRLLPNDGTLNQNLSYQRARAKSIQYGCSYGYDLSAATDRLPIGIQVSILRGVFQFYGMKIPDSVTLSLLWKEILVNRPFMVPKIPKGVEDPQELALTDLYYEVGQPMGALSSFNMLAITHHMIMQDIAHQYGHKGWCELYEITGDDIVIFDSTLAKEYCEYMKSLGLEINQKKSVVSISKACGEYLKKTWINDTDVSMISWKQLYQNHSTLMGRVSDALYFLQKWSTSKHSIQAIVRRASLTWVDIQSPRREVINVPLLALMSTALRQSRLPLEKFFLFLLRPGEAWFEFKTLYSKISNIKINQQEVIEFLESFIRGDGIKIPDTRDWTRRILALKGPFTGLRGGLIEKIVDLQKKIHGDVAVVLPKITKEELQNYPARVRMELVCTEVQPQKPFQTLWSWQNIQALEREVAGCVWLQKSFRDNKTWVIGDLIQESIIEPSFNRYCSIISRIIPQLRKGQPWLDRELLQTLDITRLLDILDALISLESVLTAHEVSDEERRVAHKVSLSVLKTLKPSQLAAHHKIVDTTPMSPEWDRMPMRMRREYMLSIR